MPEWPVSPGHGSPSFMDDRSLTVDVIDERFAVYTVVMLGCSLVAALAGTAVAVAAFVTVVGAIEVTYWLGCMAFNPGRSGTSR